MSLPLQLSLACIFYIPSVTWYTLLFDVTPYIAVFLLHLHLCYIKSICPQEHINSHFVQGSTSLLLASCYLFTSTRNTSDFILYICFPDCRIKFGNKILKYFWFDITNYKEKTDLCLHFFLILKIFTGTYSVFQLSHFLF